MSTTDIPALKPNQILALVVLMAEARELNNNELKELAGFSLTGQDNAYLEKTHGLVETDRSHRPFSHQLSEKGWRVVRELSKSDPPKTGGSAIRSLFTVLLNVQRSLDRLHMSHAEFFKQGASVAPIDAVPAASLTVEDRIRAAYRTLAKAPGDWVGLADLRDKLPGVDRNAVDDGLLALLGKDGVRIIPTANSKALKPRDRAAALRIGNEDNHALSIGQT